jgi:CheY-like chemotaxis protein
MKRKVLVVDDELHMRNFVVTLLETSGFEALTADSGLKGLELAKQHRPALVIMDVMMPGDGGMELYRNLTGDPELKDIPIIIISAVAQKTFVHSQSLLNQCRGEEVPEPAIYIEKPPEPEELRERIREALSDSG